MGHWLKYTAPLLAAAIAAIPSYFLTFSMFAARDDEGYLMMSIHEVLSGHVPYDGTYLQYGPAYFLFKLLLHGLTGAALSHDVVRLTSVVLWVITAAVLGAAVLKLTRSAFVSATAVLASAYNLWFIAVEPGHPQELCALLTSVMLLGAALIDGAGRRWALALTGAAAGLLLMIKVNAGAYAGLAFGTGMLILTAGWFSGRVLRPLAFLALLVLPSLVISKHIPMQWGFILCFSITATIASSLIAGRRLAQPFLEVRDWAWTIAGTALGAGLPVAWVISRGTSMHALLDGILFQHLGMASGWAVPASVGWQDVAVSSLLLLLCVGWTLDGWRSQPWTGIAMNLAKLAAAAAVALSAVGFRPFADHIAPWSAWMIAAQRDPDKQGSRILAALLLSVQMLYAYPVAGSQWHYAYAFGAIASLIAGYDAITELRAQLPGRIAGIEKITAACLTVLLCVIVGSSITYTRRAYRERVPSGLLGAGDVRLPAEQAAELTHVTEAIRGSCTHVFSMPGMFSFNFWAQLPTPTRINQTNWIGLFSNAQQKTIIRDLETTRACVVYNPEAVKFWLLGRESPKSPLADYISARYAVASSFGQYKVMVQNQPDKNTFQQRMLSSE